MYIPGISPKRFGRIDCILLALISLILLAPLFLRGSEFIYQWEWQVIPQYILRFDETTGTWQANILLQGLITTIKLSIWGMLLATIFGVTMALFRLSSVTLLQLIGQLYVGLVRNTPPLVLIFIVYFFVSNQIIPLLGIENYLYSMPDGMERLTELLFAPSHMLTIFWAALITLALFEGAYITEIVRAGIESVERSQWEGAKALGLSPWQQFRHVVAPQATLRSLPPLAGQFVSTIKDSAIVSVISVQELTFQGMELMASTYLTLEVWLTITLLYFILTFSCSLAVRHLEKRMSQHLRPT